MKQYILNRLVSGIIVLIGITIFAFLLIHLIPGDPARIMMGDQATTEQLETMREQLGLNKPLTVQYIDYIRGVVKGDLGTSFRTGRPVAVEISERFISTMKLAVSALIIAVVAGVIMGVLAAKYKNTFVDVAVTSIATLGISLPGFWVGLMFIQIFVVKFGIFKLSGETGLTDLMLPALTLSIVAIASKSRLTRTGMVEVLSADYIRTARAKGLKERVILFRHALRNVLIPIVTSIGLTMAGLLGGTVIIEQVFNWPGLGTLAIGAIYSRDFPIIQGFILFMGVSFVVINIIIDILYRIIDPRVEY
ncbi:ABC transporter permease [Cytobacillus sp. FJAT-53684]|uniref:ABC transporter permease n=1 Tax=Cytobacillus mangrovibacter TaxID=3299024 RepID=A0ABW6JVD4_9BACI